jgi:hypothetical protein
MFEWDDILIVGDSFCQQRDLDTDWPQQLALALTGQPYVKHRVPRGHGFAGASWWSARKRLLEDFEIRVPKLLIMCHTEANRLPSDYDFGINSSSAQTGKVFIQPTQLKNYTPKIAKAAGEYFLWLASREFHEWTQKQWFKELDDLLDHHQIPYVVHLHCFQHFKSNDHIFRRGITSKDILYDISQSHHHALGARNHFSIEQNREVATALERVISNPDQTWNDNTEPVFMDLLNTGSTGESK